MFQLRPEHMEAFRPVVRAQFPNRLVAAASEQGHQAARDPASGDVVAKDRRGTRPASPSTGTASPKR